jgi:hypothetical protein
MRAALILAAAACSSPAKPVEAPAKPPSNEVRVPFGDAPIVDGTVNDAEWSRASTVALADGITLRLLHDRSKVYVAIVGRPGRGMAFGCFVVSDPDRVAVLHASAKLGMASYSGTGTYRPASKTYDWLAADAMLAKEGWMANTVGPDSTQQEFAITFARLGLPATPRPIALGYINFPPDAQSPDDAGVVVWPTGLDDATADKRLLGGFNPDDVRFDPSRWITLRVD